MGGDGTRGRKVLLLLRWPATGGATPITCNVLEGAFVEVRRRTNIIGRLPGETSALSLACSLRLSVLLRALLTACLPPGLFG